MTSESLIKISVVYQFHNYILPKNYALLELVMFFISLVVKCNQAK